jgi:hypothetical protein
MQILTCNVFVISLISSHPGRNTSTEPLRPAPVSRNATSLATSAASATTSSSRSRLSFPPPLPPADLRTAARALRLRDEKESVSLVWAISRRNVVNGKYLPDHRPAARPDRRVVVPTHL